MAIHIDDIVILCNSIKYIKVTKNNIKSVLDIKDLGELWWHLGMEFTQDCKAQTIILSQSKYICSVIDHFGMTDTNTALMPLDNCLILSKVDGPTPDDIETKSEMANVPHQDAIGSLPYAAICMSPDIAFSLQTLSQFSSNPGPKHWTAAKRLIRYLKKTVNLSLTLGGLDIDTTQLTGWCNTDWACDPDDQKSITEFILFLGTSGTCYSSKNKLVLHYLLWRPNTWVLEQLQGKCCGCAHCWRS